MRKMACPDSLSKVMYQNKAISSRAFVTAVSDSEAPPLPSSSPTSAAAANPRRESDTTEEPSTDSKPETTDSKEDNQQD